jgi:hypothetical protein
MMGSERFDLEAVLLAALDKIIHVGTLFDNQKPRRPTAIQVTLKPWMSADQAAWG